MLQKVVIVALIIIRATVPAIHTNVIVVKPVILATILGRIPVEAILEAIVYIIYGLQVLHTLVAPILARHVMDILVKLAQVILVRHATHNT